MSTDIRGHDSTHPPPPSPPPPRPRVPVPNRSPRLRGRKAKLFPSTHGLTRIPEPVVTKLIFQK